MPQSFPQIFNNKKQIFERGQGKSFYISIRKHKSEALCLKVSPVFIFFKKQKIKYISLKIAHNVIEYIL